MKASKDNSKPIIFSPWLEESFRKTDRKAILQAMEENRKGFTSDIFGKLLKKVSIGGYLSIFCALTFSIITTMTDMEYPVRLSLYQDLLCRGDCSREFDLFKFLPVIVIYLVFVFSFYSKKLKVIKPNSSNASKR